jgi:predicted DNA-binding transcriptional regulator AlpA
MDGQEPANFSTELKPASPEALAADGPDLDAATDEKKNLGITPGGEPIHDKPFLTVGDLAARWDVSKATVLDWHQQGRVPGALRLGGTPRGRLRWPKQAVEEIERAWGHVPAPHK